MKDSDVCFGNFKTNKPDNNPGAEFIGFVSANGLAIPINL